MYIGDDDEASADDSEPGKYTVKIVLTDDVELPDTETSGQSAAREAQTDGIYNARLPYADDHEVYINGRKAEFADAELIVRHVSDPETARTDAMFCDYAENLLRIFVSISDINKEMRL